MYRTFLAFGIILATTAPACTGRHQSSASLHPRPAALEAVERATLEELRRTQTPGAVVGIVRADRLVWARGFGQADVETGAPPTPAMLFRIASLTKPFTSLAAASLAEDGRLDLQAPLGRYVAGLPPRLSQLTTHQLLSHTAGLPFGPVPEGSPDPRSALDAAARRLSDEVVLFPPGEIFSYSNIGYTLVGRVIEAAGGASYAEVLRSRGFEPLGMASTGFDPTELGRVPIARGYDAGQDGRLEVVPPRSGNAERWPAAGMYSTVEDLARFAIAFVNEGRIGDRQVIPPSLSTSLSKPYAAFHSGPGHYGYGLRTYEHRGVRVVEGGGTGIGFRSLLYLVPEHRLAVIVLANRAGGRPRAIAEAVLEQFLGLPPESAPPAPGSPVHADEARRYTGMYINSARVEVIWRDGRLFLNDGARQSPLRRVDGDRFVAEAGEGERWVVFVPGADGRAAYLHMNMRAHRRVGDRAEASIRKAELTRTGLRFEGGHVITWFPRDSLPEQHMRALTDSIDQAVGAVKRILGAPYPWQRIGGRKLAFYFAPGRFGSGVTPDDLGVLIALWRIPAGQAPYLNEAATALLTPVVPTPAPDSAGWRQILSRWPLWLMEGFPDYLAQVAAAETGLHEADIFRIGGPARADSTCAARVREPGGRELLAYVGRPGAPEALRTDRGRAAPIFIACAHSLSKHLVERVGIEATVSLFAHILQDEFQPRFARALRRDPEVFRREWLAKLGITELE